MSFITRPATMDDLEDLCRIEISALPSLQYMYDNRNFYFGEENKGEMILSSTEDGYAVGMGQYSVLPDGAGWLEILRVQKEYQGQGVGKSIYKRYMELAEETNAPSVAMYTGITNLASKGLAEINGFTLAAAYTGDDLILEGPFDAPNPDFAEVTDPEEAKKLIAPYVEKWGPFFVLNRTFFHYNDALYPYLCKNHMVYSDGENVVVLGARMLHERGLHIGMYGGDANICLPFAAAKAYELGSKKLTVMYPSPQATLREEILAAGYKDSGELIVMEWKRP